MRREDFAPEGGPVETPDIDLGPGNMPEGIAVDGSLHVPDGMDPLEFDSPTGHDGQPPAEGTTDAGGQDAPGADTTADPQTPEPASDTSPKPWEGQHPDKLDLASMTTEQKVQWATENPEVFDRYLMRQDDYSQKTEETARREDALDAREAALAAREAQLHDQQSGVQQQGSQQQQPQQQGQDGALAWMQGNGMQFYQQLNEQLGREPNFVEFATYAARRAAEDAARQEVQPLQQRVDETAHQFEERQRQALAQNLKSELDSLIEEKPQVATPERMQALNAYLERHPSLLNEPKPIRTAYNALYAEADAQATQAGKNHARQQQAAASQLTPATPPTEHEGASGADIPRGFDEVYEWASRQVAAGTLLDSVPAP